MMAADKDVVEDFKTQFYNLEGVHYNERKKNFYKLLYSADPDTLAQVDIEPRNYLERIFCVDILIRSKQMDKLMHILTEGNGVLVSRILKQKWFFKEAFNHLDENALVNEFLPTLSFALRMKVLKKMALSFSEERMDNIFECILERYGLFIAAQFLFSCSSTKIIDVLRNNELTLSSEQLKRMLDRDFGLLKVYFEEYQKNKKTKFQDYDFLSHLLLKYPNLYFDLAPYVEDFPSVGRRTTKSLLQIDGDEILKDLNKVKNKFNLSTITREVKNFDTEHFHKLFPSNKTALGDYTNQNTICKFLKKYPRKKRWNTFALAYKGAYNEDVLNHLNDIEWPLAQMFSNEILMKWAEIKYKANNEREFLKYLEPKKGFLLIKEKLNVTSNAYDRSEMLQGLIKSCHTYKNYEVYEELVKYIYVRHRNEEKGIRTELLNQISKNIDYELTTESFWTHVNQLIEVFRVKNEPLPYKNIVQYLTFLVKKHLPLDQAFAQFVKDCVLPDECFWKFYYFTEPTIKAEALKLALKHMDVVADPVKRQQALTKLMDEIVNFNVDNKNDYLWVELNEFPAIFDCIKAVLQADDFNDEKIACIQCLIKYNYGEGCHQYLKVYEDDELLTMVKRIGESKRASEISDAMYIAVKKPRTTRFQHGLLDFYFITYLGNHPNYFKRQHAKYFISEEPEVFAKYFDQIVDIECRHSILDYAVIKQFAHLLLDKKLISSLIPDSPCLVNAKLIEKLSKIMNTDEFIRVTSTYMPSETMKLDDMDAEQRQLFELQCGIIKALKNLDDCPKIIPLLYTFCQGDFLQPSLPLLYKVVYRSSEQQTIPLIEVLADRAVSARKHAVHLSFVVLPQKTAINTFNAIAFKENNVSAKKYLLQAVLKYYLKNPYSQYLLDMVINSLAFVHENDTELISTLMEAVRNVPWPIKPVFFEHVWHFLDDMAKKGVAVIVQRTKMLSIVNEYDAAFFLKIKDSVCKNIITQYFCSEDVTIAETMYDFVAKYLLVHKDEDHFKFVFDIIKSYNKEVYWQTCIKDKLQRIFKFFDRVYTKYSHQDTGFFRLFKTYWEQVFSHEQCFTEYIVLKLMLLYSEHSGIEAFSRDVSKLFHELNLEYGPYIDDLLLNCIKRFFLNESVANNQSFSTVQLAYHLLKSDLSELNCTIVSILIRGCEKNGLYWEIVAMLKSLDSSSIRIRCNTLFKW